jgi:hypothetical protein
MAAQPKEERMTRYPTLFLTERGQRHQAAALRAAPPELEVVVLRQPDRNSLLAHLRDAAFLITERSSRVDGEMVLGRPEAKTDRPAGLAGPRH